MSQVLRNFGRLRGERPLFVSPKRNPNHVISWIYYNANIFTPPEKMLRSRRHGDLAHSSTNVPQVLSPASRSVARPRARCDDGRHSRTFGGGCSAVREVGGRRRSGPPRSLVVRSMSAPKSKLLCVFPKRAARRATPPDIMPGSGISVAKGNAPGTQDFLITPILSNTMLCSTSLRETNSS